MDKNCIKEQLLPIIDCSLSDELGWLKKNESFDDESAKEKIVDYIKQNWDTKKYMFTIEKTKTLTAGDSTSHIYEVI